MTEKPLTDEEIEQIHQDCVTRLEAIEVPGLSLTYPALVRDACDHIDRLIADLKRARQALAVFEAINHLSYTYAGAPEGASLMSEYYRGLSTMLLTAQHIAKKGLGETDDPKD